MFFVSISFVNTQYAFGEVSTSTMVKTIEGTNSSSSWLGDIILDFIIAITTAIGGMVAGIGGVMLDLTVNATVLNMGTLLGSNTDVGKGIIGLWKVLRDIINIFFIFGVIYIGIKTILDSQKSETRRTFGMLIIAALIINFSLYITEVVIDFSNIAAVQVYNQIADMPIAKGFATDKVSLSSGSIAGAFLDVASVGSIFAGNEVDIAKHLGLAGGIFYGLFMMIFLVIAGAVFFMGALLLIKRFIALILYMIFSPAMFIGWILPSFASEQEQWRKGFIQQAFVAPLFLFMLYLSLVVLKNLQESIVGTSGEGFGGIISGNKVQVGTFQIVLFFALAIGFVYASIKVADKMSKAGASSALGFIDSGRSAIQGAVYRNTAGWGLSKAVDKIDAANRASEDPEASKLKKAGARSLRILTGGEQGRAGIEKAANAGMGGRGRDTVKHEEEARKQRAARGLQIHNIEHALAGPDQIAKEKAMRDASSAQLIEMIHHGQEKAIIENAGLLSDSQTKALMEDKGVDDALRTKLGQARGEQIAKRLIKDNQTHQKDAAGNLMYDAAGEPIMGGMPEVISKADTSELKAMGFDEALKHAGKLTAKQIEDWKDLTRTERDKIKKERKSQLETEFNGGAGAADLFKRIRSDEEKSKLPDSILKDPHAAPYLNTNVLAKIVDNNGITDADRATIKANVMGPFGTGRGAANSVHRKFADFFDKNNAGQRY